MTLQYRIRPKYEDDRWRHRIRICNLLILESVDEWCNSDLKFATEDCVRCSLHLFSKRCALTGIREHGVKSQLLSESFDCRKEYAMEWPRRTDADCSSLVGSMSQVLLDAEAQWECSGIGTLSVEDVAGQLVDEIVAHQFVVFHRTETTRRDTNHWGI